MKPVDGRPRICGLRWKLTWLFPSWGGEIEAIKASDRRQKLVLEG